MSRFRSVLLCAAALSAGACSFFLAGSGTGGQTHYVVTVPEKVFDVPPCPQLTLDGDPQTVTSGGGTLDFGDVHLVFAPLAIPASVGSARYGVSRPGAGDAPEAWFRISAVDGAPPTFEAPVTLLISLEHCGFTAEEEALPQRVLRLPDSPGEAPEEVGGQRLGQTVWAAIQHLSQYAIGTPR